MLKTVVQALAQFANVPEYQVELWDRPLVDHFVRHPELFQVFVQASESLRHQVWFESYRASRGFAPRQRFVYH